MPLRPALGVVRAPVRNLSAQMTDMEAVYTYEGTDSMRSLVVGREITGLRAFA